ncbi:MAG TPA: hypothetical protein PKE45_21440 [Caldilineaceae bacterium]|nr:hypothetical protein [Caldilineaceae bacterium]
MNKVTGSIVVVLVLMLALAGCNQNVQQTLCPGLDTLTGGVDQLANVRAEATTKDLKTALAKVDPAIQAVRTANRALNLQPVTDLLSSYDKMAASINARPDDAPIAGETADQLRSDLANVQAALDEAKTKLNCAR